MPLSVEVKRATNLPKLKALPLETLILHNWNDPFCELTFKGQMQSTKPLYNTRFPEWNEKLEWALEDAPSPDEVIEVVMFSHERSGWHREMCTATIPLADVLKKGSDIDRTITFKSLGKEAQCWKDDKGDDKVPTLCVSLTYMPPLSEILREKVSSLETELEQTKTRNAEVSEELAKMKEKLQAALKEVQNALDKMKEHLES